MPLILDAGLASLTGKRRENQDACLLVTPSTGEYQAQGALIAVADGVGGGPDGKGASEAAVATLREAYYSAPETWTLEHALREAVSAAHQAVLGGTAGRATTLTCLALRHHRWQVAHVGDTRAWLWRAGALTQITRDHHLPNDTVGNIITRACGMDEDIHPDLFTGELGEGDVLLVTSDGVHGYLPVADIEAVLTEGLGAQESAERLAQRALDAGSLDNVSACVVRIVQLPAETERELADRLATLPVREPPEIGSTLDGFRIEVLLHSGRLSALYLARDGESGERVVLKFPNPRQAEDPRFVESFLREEWIARRVQSPHLVQMLALRAGRRSQLYSAMAYHPGQALSKLIRARGGLPVEEACELARQLLTALDHLHRRGVIHRDVKPDNIIVDEEGHLRLIDLGVARIERLDAASGVPIGTPSYMAPEIFTGVNADERSDIYSAAVTLYEMLTQRYPYGEIEAFSHPRFTRMTPPERYRPDLPAWITAVLAKACAAAPDQRYADVVEFAHALAAPPPLALATQRQPLLERIPPGRWKLLFMISLVVNGVLFALLLLLR
jgi:serine/threonine protein phosphatase PrpC